MHDYVIVYGTGHNVTVLGVFENWSEAFRYRRDRMPKSIQIGAVIKPVQGIG